VDMRFWIAIIFIAFLLPLPAIADRGVAVRPVSPLGSEITGNQWLFVIGIDSYIHWPRLKTAASDAKSLRDVLLSRYHFDQEHLIELYDEQATRKNIIDRLRSLATRVSAEDSLVIYYAGHGHIDPITKEGSWIPVESELREASAWISNHYIKNYLRVDAIKAKHILLVSDSCFSGDFLRGTRGKLPDVTEEVIKKAYTLSSRQAISSGGLEPVSDEGFGKNSVFSHFLVKTLRENQKPFLVPSDFFNNVRAGVAENAQQFPVFGTLRETGGQEGGELVLFLKTDDVLKILSTKTSEKKEEFERLRQLEGSAQEAKRKEAEEVAKQEKALAALDSEIIGMKQRLGEKAPRSNDSLDTMLAMVRQKEDQEKKLDQLRKQQEEEQRKRQEEIARLKEEKDDQIIAMFKPEVEKYKEIVASKYGKGLQKEAWKDLISKCPEEWAEGVQEGDVDRLMSSAARKRLKEARQRELSSLRSYEMTLQQALSGPDGKTSIPKSADGQRLQQALSVVHREVASLQQALSEPGEKISITKSVDGQLWTVRFNTDEVVCVVKNLPPGQLYMISLGEGNDSASTRKALSKGLMWPKFDDPSMSIFYAVPIGTGIWNSYNKPSKKSLNLKYEKGGIITIRFMGIHKTSPF
jgi:hypothetical protein